LDIAKPNIQELNLENNIQLIRLNKYFDIALANLLFGIRSDKGDSIFLKTALL
jgi:hypothetical protein